MQQRQNVRQALYNRDVPPLADPRGGVSNLVSKAWTPWLRAHGCSRDWELCLWGLGCLPNDTAPPPAQASPGEQQLPGGPGRR